MRGYQKSGAGICGLGGIVIILTALINCFVFTELSYGFSPRTERISVAGPMYEKPDKTSRSMADLHAGDEVTLIHQNYEWYIVKLSDNRLGWVHESLFMEKSTPPDTSEKEIAVSQNDTGGKILIVKVPSARVREAPSLESSIEFGLQQGDKVSLLEKKEDWYLIRVDDGSMGWAHEKLFTVSDKQTPSTASVPHNTETDVTDSKEIRDIQVDITPEGEEKVIFTLNGFYPPETFVLEDSLPKVVCDFKGASLKEGISKRKDVNGKFLQRIRIGVHKDENPKIRVVLDLVPDRDYEVEQIFFRKENLYTLTFKPARK